MEPGSLEEMASSWAGRQRECKRSLNHLSEPEHKEMLEAWRECAKKAPELATVAPALAQTGTMQARKLHESKSLQPNV